jgi:8-oxo-dGTP pyrophosphatase MutT (NUDIX family)
MPTDSNHTTPNSVSNLAKQILAIHADTPLDEQVGGVTVAKQLAKGDVPTAVLERMRRFFTAQAKTYTESLQQQHTAHTNALVRSWDMYGGDAGKAWVERELKNALKEGYTLTDPITALLELDPEGVYDSFSVGAWRWEYDLTPRTAATFCEEYQRATGNILDLGKAFGASAGTIGKAIHRKYNAPNSFELAMRALKIDDTALQLSATIDIEDYKIQNTQGLSESLKTGIWKRNTVQQGRVLWQVLIAHCILLQEAPHLLTSESGFDKMARPRLHDEPKNITQYSDTTNIFHNYFNSHIMAVENIIDATHYEKLQNSLMDVLNAGWMGKDINRFRVRTKIFPMLRKFVKANKFAPAAFNTLLTSWNKGDWQTIYDMLPIEADITIPFSKLIQENPQPKDGLKLQQTLTNKKWLKQIKDVMYEKYQFTDMEQIAIRDSHLSAMTPAVGIYSLIARRSGSEHIILGVYNFSSTETKKGPGNTYGYSQEKPILPVKMMVVLGRVEGGKVTELIIHNALLMANEATPLKAHYQLPGTTYSSDVQMQSSLSQTKQQAVGATVLGTGPDGKWFDLKDGTVYLINGYPSVWAGNDKGTVYYRPIRFSLIPNPSKFALKSTDKVVVHEIGLFTKDAALVAAKVADYIGQYQFDSKGAGQFIRLEDANDIHPTLPNLFYDDSFVVDGQTVLPLFWRTDTTKAVTESELVTITLKSLAIGSLVFGVVTTGEVMLAFDVQYNDEGDVITNHLGGKPGTIPKIIVTKYDTDGVALPQKVIDGNYGTEIEVNGHGTGYGLEHGLSEGWNTTDIFIINGQPCLLFLSTWVDHDTVWHYRIIFEGLFADPTDTYVITPNTTVDKTGFVGIFDYTHATIRGMLQNYASNAEELAKVSIAPLDQPDELGVTLPEGQTFPTVGPKDIFNGKFPVFWSVQDGQPKLWLVDIAVFSLQMLVFTSMSLDEIAQLVPAQTEYDPPPSGDTTEPDGWKQPLNNPSGHGPTLTTISKDGYDFDDGLTFANSGDSYISINLKEHNLKPITDPTKLVVPIEEPPFAKLSEGDIVSAGVVCIDTNSFDNPRIVMVKPSNEFGYKTAFPKGRVEAGESVVKAAVRETYEETGLVAEVLSHLGDYKTSSGITRLYVGRIRDGHPLLAQWETDGVLFVEPDAVEISELRSNSGSHWQAFAMDDVTAYIKSHPEIGTVQPDSVEGGHTQVTQSHEVVEVDGESHLVPDYGDANADVYNNLLAGSELPLTGDIIKELQLNVIQDFLIDTAVKIETVFDGSANYGRLMWLKHGKPSAKDKLLIQQAGFPILVGGKPVATFPYFYIGSVWVETADDDGETYKKYVIATNGAHATTVVLEDSPKFVWGDEIVPIEGNAPHFTHSDPTIQEQLASVYFAGGVSMATDDGGSSITLAQFKHEFKQAMAVSHKYGHTWKWADFFTKNNVVFVSKLFTTASTSHDYNMTAKYFEALMEDALVVIKSPTKPKDVSKAKVTVESTSTNPVVLATVANPDPSQFSDTEQKMPGGSKPNWVLEDTSGRKWFYKTGTVGDANGPSISKIEGAVYKISELVKGNNIPVGTMEWEGKFGSLQPLLLPNDDPPSNPDMLSDVNKAELLQQHAVDMFVGDHDGHVGNLLLYKGHLRAIDKGQAFRFLASNEPESLDPSFHNGNMNLSGKSYCKLLLVAWGKGEAEISPMAFAAMHKTVLRIQSLAEGSYLADLLQPIFEGLTVSDAQKKKMLASVIARAKAYEDSWLTVLTNLRPDFQWSGGGGNSSLAKLDGIEEEAGLTVFEDEAIGDANANPWRGKALQLDREHIEGQSVMVKAVTHKGKPATLIYFKLTAKGGDTMAAHLQPLSTVHSESKAEFPSPYPSSASSVTTTYRIQTDVTNGYYEIIRAAAGNLNYHLNGSTQAGGVKKSKVNSALELTTELQSLEKSGDEHEVQMATLYLSHISFIKDKYEALSDNLLEPLPYEVKPVKDKKKKAKAPQFESALTLGVTPIMPTLVNNNGTLEVTGFAKGNAESGGDAQQYRVTDSDGATVGLSATKGADSIGARGQCWAFFARPLTADSVGHLTALISKATSISMKPATEIDKEYLYWWKQAHTYQAGGSITSDSGDTTVDSDLQEISKLYATGSTAQAIALLKQFVVAQESKLFGNTVTVTELEQSSNVHGEFSGGSGRQIVTRVGWDTKRIVKVLGKGNTICHTLNHQPSIYDFLLSLGNAPPVLVSLEDRPYHGVDVGSSSATSDFIGGGSANIFGGLRSQNQHSPKLLHFHASLALRVDVYQVGTGDTYGNISKYKKITLPSNWSDASDAGLSITSHAQINIPHQIDLLEYLEYADCVSETDKDECIWICKMKGWKFKHGTPETIFRTEA